MAIKTTKKLKFAAIITMAVAIGGVSTLAVRAAIPSSTDGQVHSCYRNSASLTDAKGSVRLIDSDAAQSCNAQETALNWNQSATGGLRKDLSNIDYYSPVSDGVPSFALLDLQGINFSNSNLSQGNFRSAILKGANLTNTNLSSSNLASADMTNQHLVGTNLASAVFTGTNISGVTWSNVTCPDGTNSNDNANTCVGHLNL